METRATHPNPNPEIVHLLDYLGNDAKKVNLCIYSAVKELGSPPPIKTIEQQKKKQQSIASPQHSDAEHQ